MNIFLIDVDEHGLESRLPEEIIRIESDKEIDYSLSDLSCFDNALILLHGSDNFWKNFSRDRDSDTDNLQFLVRNAEKWGYRVIIFSGGIPNYPIKDNLGEPDGKYWFFLTQSELEETVSWDKLQVTDIKRDTAIRDFISADKNALCLVEEILPLDILTQGVVLGRARGKAVPLTIFEFVNDWLHPIYNDVDPCCAEGPLPFTKAGERSIHFLNPSPSDCEKLKTLVGFSADSCLRKLYELRYADLPANAIYANRDILEFAKIFHDEYLDLNTLLNRALIALGEVDG